MKTSPRILVAAAVAVVATCAFWLVERTRPASGATREPLARSAAPRGAEPSATNAATADAGQAMTAQAPATSEAADAAGGLERLLASLPAGPFRESLVKLDPRARRVALSKLARLDPPREDQASLRAASDGGLYYVCASPVNVLPTAAAKVATTTRSSAVSPAATATATAVAVANPPVRHSRAGAVNVLYLDFNGMTITGTRWNTTYGVKAYTAQAFDLDGDPTTFSDAEQAAIVQIWERVAEDYAPFDVDVTTEEPASFTTTTGRALITANVDATGVAMPDSTMAGVSFVDVFGDFDYATSSSPALIYYTAFGGVVGNIAEAVAHELGHNVGLSHDGTVGIEYYGGHGSGDISWGPIMGAPYGRNVTQWSKGEYYNANNKQDDVAIIAAVLGTRVDEAGAALKTAAAASVAMSTGGLSAAGVFTAATDVEIYSFSAGAGTIALAASTYKAASGSNGGDADIKLELLNSAGTVVATADPAASTGASLTYKAAAGTYYARLTPAGTGSPLLAAPSGYTSYGSIGQFSVTGTIVVAAPAITSATSASIGAGQSYTYAIIATNSPTSYAAAGLPAGLVLDATTGVISGSATEAGTFQVALSATNAAGTGTATLTLTVTAGAPMVTSLSASSTVLAPQAGLTLSVNAVSYAGAASIVWKRNGVTLTGATGSTLTVAQVSTADSGYYQAFVTNTAGTTASAVFFVRVAPISTAVDVWGDNTYGQKNVPTGLINTVAIAAGPNHVLALQRDGSVVGWGASSVGQVSIPAGLNTAVALAAGSYHSLALKADGTVVAWGYNSNGQTAVPGGLANVVGVAAGYYHSLALKADGTVVAWGDNTYGQSTVPSGLANVVAIAASRFGSWALKADGSLVGWGASSSGQLTQPTGLGAVTAVAAGAEHVLGLKTDGTVAEWGYTGGLTLPAGSGAITAIAAGLYHSLVINAQAQVIAWGANAQGQITVPAITRVLAVAAGDYHSVALRDTSGPLAPAFTTQPLDQKITVGASTSFLAVATGWPTPTYRWQVSTNAGGTWADLADNDVYAGSATTTLTVTRATTVLNATAYRCVASNSVQSGVISKTATLTVAAVNTAPTISTIANQTVNEDTAMPALAFTVADAESAASALVVTAASSNPTLVPTANIVLAGTNGSRTVALTPAANQSGSSTITLTVTDGALSASRAFLVTVTAVNDAPTISTIADQALAVSSATSALAFTIGDVETAAGSLTLTKASSNTTLVPTASIVLGGSGANRTVTVTPVAKLTGSATITLTVSDGAATASASFVVKVAATNTAPTITDIANQSVPQGTTTAAIAFTVGDAQTAAANLTVTASSSDKTLVPDANLTLGGSGANRTIRVTPATGRTGSTTITVTVSDGSLSAADTFTLTVTAVNQAPTISAVGNQTILIGASTSTLTFKIADLETAATSLTLTKGSSNTTFLPLANIVLGGSGSDRTVVVTPAAKTAGSATVTLTVSDGTLKTAGTFSVRTVTSNDAFADALTLNGTTAQAAAKNTTATKQGSEPAHAGNAGGHSLWWQWTAPSSGVVTLNTSGSSFDTLLAVYTGGSLTALSRVAADDNGGTNLTSALVFAAKSGVTYWIAVDGANGATGDIRLNLTESDVAAAALTTTAAGVTARSRVIEVTTDAVTILTLLQSETGLAGVSLHVLLPEGWSYLAGTALAADQRPAKGETDLIEWSWAAPSPRATVLIYRLSKPAGTAWPATMDGLLLVQRGGSVTGGAVQTVLGR